MRQATLAPIAAPPASPPRSALALALAMTSLNDSLGTSSVEDAIFVYVALLCFATFLAERVARSDASKAPANKIDTVN
jgi:hypothetical protein